MFKFVISMASDIQSCEKNITRSKGKLPLEMYTLIRSVMTLFCKTSCAFKRSMALQKHAVACQEKSSSLFLASITLVVDVSIQSRSRKKCCAWVPSPPVNASDDYACSE